jgi:hypothetical protein
MKEITVRDDVDSMTIEQVALLADGPVPKLHRSQLQTPEQQ